MIHVIQLWWSWFCVIKKTAWWLAAFFCVAKLVIENALIYMCNVVMIVAWIVIMTKNPLFETVLWKTRWQLDQSCHNLFFAFMLNDCDETRAPGSSKLHQTHEALIPALICCYKFSVFPPKKPHIFTELTSNIQVCTFHLCCISVNCTSCFLHLSRNSRMCLASRHQSQLKRLYCQRSSPASLPSLTTGTAGSHNHCAQ